MITYVNSGNDAKRFNTFVLAAKHSLTKKQQAINTQIDYLKSVYNRYVSHYNQLQKLIKEVNDLTGESRYTKVDYSDFPAIDISASFSMKLSNVSLVPKEISYVRFKNTIEDLRNNFSDLSLSIKSFYNRAMVKLSPYGSMRQKTNNIREESSKASAVVGMNISTALTEGDLSEKDWSNIKEHAEREKNEKEKTLEEPEPTGPTSPTAPSTEDLEKKAREGAEDATETAFNKEQSNLEDTAKKAREKLNEANELVSKYGETLQDSSYYDIFEDTNGYVNYKDPMTGETFLGFVGDTTTQTKYTDAHGVLTTLVYSGDTGTYTVTKNGEEVGTYTEKEEGVDAFNKAAGKDILGYEDGIYNGIKNTIEKTYEENKEKATEARDKAKTESDKADKDVEEHRNSGTDGSSGGT